MGLAKVNSTKSTMLDGSNRPKDVHPVAVYRDDPRPTMLENAKRSFGIGVKPATPRYPDVTSVRG